MVVFTRARRRGAHLDRRHSAELPHAPHVLVCGGRRRAVPRAPLRKLAELVYTIDLPVSVLALAVSVLLPLITFAVAFRITERVSNGTHWLQKGYFLSAAIDLPPASNVGALGLTVSFASFLLVTFVRHKIVKQRLGATRSALLHRISLFCAFAAAFGGNGVAAYQHSVSRSVHNAFAALFVLSALAHFSLEAAIEWRGNLASRATCALHSALCLLAAVCTATFLAHIVFEEMRQTSLGIGKLRAAQAEMATVGCFLLYLCSYLPIFRCARIHFTITLGEEEPADTSPMRRVRSGSFEHADHRCPSYSRLLSGPSELDDPLVPDGAMHW